MTALWRGMDAAELDRQYDARGSVPSYDAEHAKYVAESARVQRDFPRQAGLVFDLASGETLDFYPAAPGAPLFVWVHGGYWRAGSVDDNAFPVRGLTAHGFAVAVVNYTLAPAVGIDEITRQVRAAIGWLHANRDDLGLCPGPFAVGGSSAGGHLVGMLLAGGWHEAFGVADDIIGTALVLSGLHWLEPLRHTRVDGWMRLDDEQIARTSPGMLIRQHAPAHLIASVGGLETDEFRRQTADYAAAWRAAGNAVTEIAMPDHNHFDIALSLCEPDGLLARTVAAIHKGTAT